MPEFCHLHAHSSFSLLDGAMSPDQYTDAVASMGMTACACTDHGTIYGLPAFQKACQARGIKPILGCEFYLVEDVKATKAAQNKTRHHQLIIAKTQDGLKNLYRLASRAWTDEDAYYYKPRIDFQMLAECADGLIATSTCISGIVGQTLLGRTPKSEGQSDAVKLDLACDIVSWFRRHFGDDYYLEAHRHSIPEEEVINLGLAKIAKKLGVPIILGQDAHYVKETDYHFQDALTTMGIGKTMQDADRARIAHPNLHVRSPQQMVDLFPEAAFKNAAEQTCLVADTIDAKIIFHGDNANYQFPVFELPPQYTSETDMIGRLCAARFATAYPNASAEVRARVRSELDMLKSMGFEGYMLILYDLMRFAREAGMRVGPGRGSAAGSVVSYLLGVTDLDPIRHSLIMERFLNPERVSMPDVDSDFPQHRRGEVIEYLNQKYGRERVAQVVTMGGIKARGGIKSFGRVFNLDYGLTVSLTNLIPESQTLNEKSLHEIADILPDVQEKILDNPDPDVQHVVEFTNKAHGYARYTGVHAAAVVITPGPVEDYLPVQIDTKRKDAILTQYEGKWLDAVGLLKLDVLGITTLSIMDYAVDMAREAGRPVDEICMQGGSVVDGERTYDDPDVYQMFQRGDTVGVFQFDKPGIQNWLRRLKPTNFNDIVAMNALHRPGPMDLIPSYIARKHGAEVVTYPHACLESVLSVTYGIPVYQEQVMEMAQVMAGYTMGGADLLRRAMGKKNVKQMEVERDKFLTGAKANGIDARTAASTFDMMAKFAGYGFNRSHAVSYAATAYQTAYLKAHHPAEFIAASLRAATAMADWDRLVFDARKYGVRVAPPDLIKSDLDFTVGWEGEQSTIRFGLSSVKGIGDAEVVKIMTERKRAPFVDLEDLLLRTRIKKSTAQALIKAGALDGIEPVRSQAFELVEPLVAFNTKMKAYAQKFAANNTTRAKEPVKPDREPLQEWTLRMRLAQEREVLGSFVSSHPLDAYRSLLEAYDARSPIPADLQAKNLVAVAGVVMSVKRKPLKSGTVLHIVTLSRPEGDVEATVFDRTYQQFGAFLELGATVMMISKCDKHGRYAGKHTADAFVPMEDVLAEWVQCIHVGVEHESQIEKVRRLMDNEHEVGAGAEVWIAHGQDTYAAGGLFTPTSKLIDALSHIGRVSTF